MLYKNMTYIYIYKAIYIFNVNTLNMFHIYYVYICIHTYIYIHTHIKRNLFLCCSDTSLLFFSLMFLGFISDSWRQPLILRNSWVRDLSVTHGAPPQGHTWVHANQMAWPGDQPHQKDQPCDLKVVMLSHMMSDQPPERNWGAGDGLNCLANDCINPPAVIKALDMEATVIFPGLRYTSVCWEDDASWGHRNVIFRTLSEFILCVSAFDWCYFCQFFLHKIVMKISCSAGHKSSCLYPSTL